jgi:hypothetical protein
MNQGKSTLEPPIDAAKLGETLSGPVKLVENTCQRKNMNIYFFKNMSIK